MASEKLIREINNIFSIRNYSYGYGSIPKTLSIGNNNIYSKYIVIELDKNKVEVPAFLIPSFYNFLTNLHNTYTRSGFKRPSFFIVPMYVGGTPIIKKTGDSLISLCCTTSLKQRMLPFNTPDNLLFYGNRGFIMHDNKALMMATAMFTIREDYAFGISDFNLNISPSVFVNKDLVSKAILSKVVPIFIENNRTSENVKIVIDDKSSFIQSPISPKDTHVNEDINNILVATLDEICLPIL